MNLPRALGGVFLKALARCSQWLYGATGLGWGRLLRGFHKSSAKARALVVLATARLLLRNVAIYTDPALALALAVEHFGVDWMLPCWGSWRIH